MYAFLFDNGISEYFGLLNDYQTSVDNIEKITGEDFYDNLDDLIENKIESVVFPFSDCEK